LDLLDPSNDPEFFWQVISGPPCIHAADELDREFLLEEPVLRGGRARQQGDHQDESGNLARGTQPVFRHLLHLPQGVEDLPEPEWLLDHVQHTQALQDAPQHLLQQEIQQEYQHLELDLQHGDPRHGFSFYRRRDKTRN
jgi:hypothetical protein